MHTSLRVDKKSIKFAPKIGARPSRQKDPPQSSSAEPKIPQAIGNKNSDLNQAEAPKPNQSVQPASIGLPAPTVLASSPVRKIQNACLASVPNVSTANTILLDSTSPSASKPQASTHHDFMLEIPLQVAPLESLSSIPLISSSIKPQIKHTQQKLNKSPDAVNKEQNDTNRSKVSRLSGLKNIFKPPSRTKPVEKKLDSSKRHISSRTSEKIEKIINDNQSETLDTVSKKSKNPQIIIQPSGIVNDSSVDLLVNVNELFFSDVSDEDDQTFSPALKSNKRVREQLLPAEKAIAPQKEKKQKTKSASKNQVSFAEKAKKPKKTKSDDAASQSTGKKSIDLKIISTTDFELEDPEVLLERPMSFFTQDSNKGKMSTYHISQHNKNVRKKLLAIQNPEKDNEIKQDSQISEPLAPTENVDLDVAKDSIADTESSKKSNSLKAAAKMIVVNGKLVLDETSLEISHKDLVGDQDNTPLNEVDETDERKFINSASFLKRKFVPKRWKWGTDFGMIASEMPNRNRYDIKSKYKIEDRKTPHLIDMALFSRSSRTQTPAPSIQENEALTQLEDETNQEQSHLDLLDDFSQPNTLVENPKLDD
ncbi:hypothetical protein BB560_003097 [Smittium megazygosporum]|uniref:Transcription factor TFIIIB component B'' Myb domain-containing protein n=1 Tax=Smittium megazygosporum TaxID=133381 RepID=A0A2T9ZD06_9FUNG|nr:hypothetical protein BB560_003097 [Smittium megazygosporum]